MKAKGKTIVLVTHEMSTVETYCHRAMLISDGSIRKIGDPTEIGREYLRLNFEHGVAEAGTTVPTRSDEVRLRDIWIENADGERQTTVETGEEILLRTELEIVRDMLELGVGFIIANADGLGIAEVGGSIEGEDDEGLVQAGRRVRLSLRLDNPLVPGRYFVHCGVSRKGGGAPVALYVHNATDFVVFGNEQRRGIVSIHHRLDAVIEGGDVR
jgi:hypothetical protein